MRLQLAMIYGKDLPQMAGFYGDTLGLKPIKGTRTESWVEFDAGGITFALHAIPSHIADQIEITSPPAVREETPLKLVFAVSDVKAEFQRLSALGVFVTLRPWGACDCVDPEGNVFQICSATT